MQMRAGEMEDLLTRLEPLCAELEPHVTDGPFGPCLKHPLVFCVIGLDVTRAALYNKQFQAKSEYVKKAIQDGEWNAAVWMHERPYRLEAFIDIADRMTDQEYWSLLGTIIVDSENLWQMDTLLRVLLVNPQRQPSRHLIMNQEEQDTLSALPDEFPVWRGCQWKNRNGLSWTLDKEKAIWFAKRFNQKPRLHSGTVAKSDVIAHFLGRGEQEILVPHNKVRDKKLELL